MVSIVRIEQRMADLGLSPYSTAKKAGLGADYVRDLLRGKVKQPSATRLRELAIVLNASPEYLMGIGDELGATPAAYDSRDELEPVNLPISFVIKEGFFEGPGHHAPKEDISKWVLSAIKDGDEWLERVAYSNIPQIPAGCLVHVIEPQLFASWLSDYAVIERKRDVGTPHELTERLIRRVTVDGERARLGGLWRDEKYTLDQLKSGEVPEYGKIVGVVVRAYSFFMHGNMWDDAPF